MGNKATVEIKAFVPSKDFELSKRFYIDLGFTVAWSSDDLAYLHAGRSSFLLQRFYVKEHAECSMMHLLVEDVEAWWEHVQAQRLEEKYGLRAIHLKIDRGASVTLRFMIQQVCCGGLVRASKPSNRSRQATRQTPAATDK